MKIRKTHPLVKIFNSSLIDLPTPSNISAWWNFGSLLGLCLGAQIVTGLLLAMHYTGDVSLAFFSVVYIMRDVNYGWLIRVIHANGASFFFICLYMHVGRGMYYNSFNLKETWTVGVTLLFLVMGTAFMGYVLPWGQMSFWGATVITNLLSAVPYLGTMMVQWVWGGFAVDNATLTRFFTIHFLLPFMIAGMVMIHLLFLHQTGSNNPLGTNSNVEKLSFHPFFSFKDMFGFIVMTWMLTMLNLISPYMLGDVENFIPANPLVTPVHIQPEWYFLFAYAILRSIPNKLGGVLALVASIAILYTLPLMKSMMNSLAFTPLSQMMFWSFVTVSLLLTWIGARPVEAPYIIVGQVMTVVYFFMFFSIYTMKMTWEKTILSN